jgi:phenylacetate-CoA ligase
MAGPDRRGQLRRLREMLPEVVSRNPFWRRRLNGFVAPRDAESYRRLPLISNRDLSADLVESPPFGSNLTCSLEKYTKYHQTSGTMGRPLLVLDTARSWEWWCDCWEAVLDACGVRSGDRAFFAFSFAPFIGFWSAYEAVARRNVLAVPGGGADTARRLRLLGETGCTVLVSTPTYALHMAETAERQGFDIAGSAIRCAILAGEPGGSIPSVRERIARSWGAEVYDHAGASEVGAYGIPCPEGRGVFVNEREFIAEVLGVGREEPVEEGQTGELVITNLGRWACPVIRYRTGDLVRPKRLDERLLLEGGILGRVDQMMLVRGVNLHPSAIEDAVRRAAGAAEFRITVTRKGAMDEAEVEVEADPASCRAIGEDVRSSFGIRISVLGVPRDSLPRWEAKAKRFRDLRE